MPLQHHVVHYIPWCSWVASKQTACLVVHCQHLQKRMPAGKLQIKVRAQAHRTAEGIHVVTKSRTSGTARCRYFATNEHTYFRASTTCWHKTHMCDWILVDQSHSSRTIEPTVRRFNHKRSWPVTIQVCVRPSKRCTCLEWILTTTCAKRLLLSM